VKVDASGHAPIRPEIRAEVQIGKLKGKKSVRLSIEATTERTGVARITATITDATLKTETKDVTISKDGRRKSFQMQLKVPLFCFLKAIAH